MSAKISQKDLETRADYLLNHLLDDIAPEDIVMIKGEHITKPLKNGKIRLSPFSFYSAF